jgi:site-specific DNA-methyltransferase (adenine-specific)
MDTHDGKPENMLYYGDNLEVLKLHIKDESVDLIYLDPPFKSNQDYNVLFQEQDGTRSAAQIKAFTDTWRWDQASVKSFDEIVEAGGQVSLALQAMKTFLGTNDMLAYLTMMAPRLVELRRVLKPTGSIYLHCDPTASHYLKMLMDAVFGPDQFRNEIIWRRTGAHGPQRSFGPIHDTLLFYSKTNEYFFRVLRKPYMRGHVESRYKKDDTGELKFISGGNVLTGAGATRGESGQTWRGFNPSAKDRHWAVPGFLTEQMPPDFAKLGVLEKLETLYKEGLIDIREGCEWPTPVRYLRPDDGHPLQDIWAYQPYTEKTVFGTDEGIDADVAWLGPTDPERLDYPTQKPVGLLTRIIRSSCPENGTVLDPFCGCGTTIEAAQSLGRRWIGIDITHLAITLIRSRLHDAFNGEPSYKVVGEPVDLEGAKALALEDRYQFQWWALGKVNARPTPPDQKKGSDRGVDGRIFFHEKEGGPTKMIVLQVKSGVVGPKDVRDLNGTRDREKAAISALLTLEDPTPEMNLEAVNAGFYKPDYRMSEDEKYRRMQIITIEQLLEGGKVEYPHLRNLTYSKAPAAKKTTQKRQKQSRF